MEKAVERKLILHGEKWDIPPEAAARVCPRLLQKVTAVVVRPAAADRFLDRASFLKIFEDETTARVPLQRLAAMQAALTTLLQNGLGAGPGAQALQPVSSVQKGVAPLPARCLDRAALVADLHERLSRFGSLVLTGSSGLGKSTLAKLVCARSGGNWLWLDLNGRKGDEVAAALRELARRLEQDDGIASVALDDLDVSAAEVRQYEHYLAGILYTARERSGYVVITARGEATAPVLGRLGLIPAVLRAVPRLAVADITQFAFQLGCPDPALARSWAEIVEVRTHGHPDLVHAHLNGVARQGWLPPRAEDWLTTPADVAEARRDARQLLNKHFNPQERDFVYRLSLVGAQFRREHAITIAGIDPATDLPGRFSTGCSGLGLNRRGRVITASRRSWREPPKPSGRTNTAGNLHAGIAEAVFTCQPLSTRDASTVIIHAIRGEAAEVLLSATVALLRISAELWPVVAADLQWLTFAKNGGGTGRLFAADPQASLWLRLLQFRVAASVRPGAGEAIALAWKAELDAAEPRDRFNPHRYLYLLTVTVLYQAPLPPRFLIAQLSELVALEPLLSTQFKDESLLRFDDAGLPGDLLPHLFCFVAARCQELRLSERSHRGARPRRRTDTHPAPVRRAGSS